MNNNPLVTPRTMKEDSNNRAKLIQHEIYDLQRTDERVKHSIRSIKERLKAAKDANCNTCPLLEEEVQRQERQSKEKDKHIMQLNLKIDRINQQHAHYAGPHSARKADLIAIREALTRNANTILSARKPPIQEIYRMQERLPQESEQLRNIEERTQLLRSREKRQRDIIKRLNSASKLNSQISEFVQNRQIDHRQEEVDVNIHRKDDTLQSFRQRLAVLEPSHEDELTSEFQGASFTSINDKYNNLNSLIGDLKTNNETLTNRNAFLEKQFNRVKEQLLQKDSQIIALREQKLSQEKELTVKIMNLTDVLQNLERQHQSFNRNIEFYQSKIANLEEIIQRDRYQYEQRLSEQTEELMAALGKTSEWQRIRNERDELKGQLKDQVIRKLALIEQISMLNKENYALKLSGSTLSQQVETLSDQNYQIKQAINDKSEQIKNERNTYAAKIKESEKMRSNLQALCQQLQQQNDALKVAKSSTQGKDIDNDLSETIKFLQEKIKRAHNELALKENTIDSNEKTISQLKWQVNKLNKSLQQQSSSLKAADNDSKAYRQQVSIISQKNQDLMAQLERVQSNSQSQIKLYSDQLSSLIADGDNLRKQIANKDAHLESLIINIAQLHEENEHMKCTYEHKSSNQEQIIQQLKQDRERSIVNLQNEINIKDKQIRNQQKIDFEVKQKYEIEINKKTRQVQILSVENNHLLSSYQLLQSQLAIVKSEANANGLRNQKLIQQLILQLKQKQSKINEDQAVLQKTNIQIQQYSSLQKHLNDKSLKVQAQLVQVKLQNEKLQDSIKSNQHSNEQLNALLDNQRQENDRLKNHILEKQAYIAQRQVSYLQKIRSLEQTISLMEQSHENQLKFLSMSKESAQEELDNLKNNLNKRQDEMDKHQKDSHAVSSQNAQIRSHLLKARQQIDQANIQKVNLVSAIRQAEISVSLKQRIQHELRAQIQALHKMQQQDRVEMQKRIQQLKIQHQDLFRIQSNMNKNALKQIQQLNNKKIQQTIKGYEDQIALISRQHQIIQSVLNAYQLKEEIRGDQSKNEFEEKIKEIAHQNKDLSAKLQESIQQNGLIQRQAKQKQARIQQFLTELQQRSEQIDKLSKQIDLLSSQKKALEDECMQLNSQREEALSTALQASEVISEHSKALKQTEAQLAGSEMRLINLRQEMMAIINELQSKNQLLEQQTSQVQIKLQLIKAQKINKDNQLSCLHIQSQHLNQSLFTYSQKITLLQQSLTSANIENGQNIKRIIDLEHILNQKDLSSAKRVKQLQQSSKQLGNQLSQSYNRMRLLSEEYSCRAQQQLNENKQLRTSLQLSYQTYNESLAQIQQKEQELIRFKQTNKILQERFSKQIANKSNLSSNHQLQIKELNIKLNSSQKLVEQYEQKMEKQLKEHQQAIQMLQQQIIQRQVQVQHKDAKYQQQSTKDKERIETLQKQIQSTKKLLQEELVERQNQIRLKQYQIERINNTLKKEIQVLKQESQEAKRLLQAQLNQRQVEISDKDIKISEIKAKHAVQVQEIREDYENTKRLLQQQIEERQIEIRDKDIKMHQTQAKNAEQLQKIIAEFDEAKCLLQQQIVERQSQIVEGELKYNSDLISIQKQKVDAIVQLRQQLNKKEETLANVILSQKETASKLASKQAQLAQYHFHNSQLLQLNFKLAQDLATAQAKLEGLQTEIEKLTKSHQISNIQSIQYLSKVKILEQSLVQKQNMILESMNQNQATLSLALESVDLKQSSQVQPQQEQPTQTSKIYSGLDQNSVHTRENQQNPSAQDVYKLKCLELENNIKALHQSYQSTVSQLQHKQSFLQSLNQTLISYQQQTIHDKSIYSHQYRQLEQKLHSAQNSIIQLKIQLESNKTDYFQSLEAIRIQSTKEKQTIQRSVISLSQQLVQSSDKVEQHKQQSRHLTETNQLLQQQLAQSTNKCNQFSSRIKESQQIYEEKCRQLTFYHQQISEIKIYNDNLILKLQQQTKNKKDIQSKLDKSIRKYQETQSELLQLEGIFIRHKINLEELKLQNKTLKQNLEQSEQRFIQNNNRCVRIDESEELFEQIIDDFWHKYQQQTLTKETKLEDYEKRLDNISLALKDILKRHKNINKRKKSDERIQAKELQGAKLQIKKLISANQHLQNEITLEQLTSGQSNLQKDEQIAKLKQQVSELTQQLSVKHNKSTVQHAKMQLKPISSFKIQQLQHAIQQTHEKELHSPGSLIDPLRQLTQSPEEEALTFPSQEDMFNLISLYLGDFQQGVHELRHQYKQLLASKFTILQFIERILVEIKKKHEMDLDGSKKIMVKVKSEEFISPITTSNVPIHSLLEKSSNNSSQNKLPLFDSPIAQIQEEDGEALITEIKLKTGSSKKKSIMLEGDIMEAFSDSQKNDDIQEMLRLPPIIDPINKSHKSESAHLIGSSLSIKSSKSQKQLDKQYSSKLKNSLMMSKLKKKK